MITLIKQDIYSIVSTKDHKVMMISDDQRYLRSYAPRIGELLTFSKHEHKTDYHSAYGNYRIYKVKDEPDLVDLEHLELSLGQGKWQGYLLLTGLPTAKKVRSRIVPTDEVISGRRHKNNMSLIIQKDFETKAGQQKIVMTIHNLERTVHELDQKVHDLVHKEDVLERDLQGGVTHLE